MIYTLNEFKTLKQHPSYKDVVPQLQYYGKENDNILSWPLHIACQAQMWWLQESDGLPDKFADTIKQCVAKWRATYPTNHLYFQHLAHMTSASQMLYYSNEDKLARLLEPLFKSTLNELREGTLASTSIGTGLEARMTCQYCTDQEFNPEQDYGQDWGLRRILSLGVDDHGLFNFTGTDLWYWAATSRNALIRVIRDMRALPVGLEQKCEDVYNLPLRLLAVEARTPEIGSAWTNRKTYKFFGGFLNSWYRNDLNSRWARYQIQKQGWVPSFEDLLVPYVPDTDRVASIIRPRIGMGDRYFGKRLSYYDNGIETVVVHNGDSETPINGSWRTQGPLPQVYVLRTGQETIKCTPSQV